MTSIIKIFDKSGTFLDEISDVGTTPRSWVLNGYGRASIPMPLNHPKLTERNFRFGNLVYITHIPKETTGQLPVWGGKILPQRQWNSDACIVSAYTGEGILPYRAMPYVSISLPASEAFKALINYANAIAPNEVQIQLGDIVTKSLPYTDELKTNAYDHIKKLMSFSGNMWQVLPKYDDNTNTLSFIVNFVDFPPAAASLFSLTSSNTEKSDPLFTEQGTIINHIFARTQSNTEADRQMVDLKDQESIDLYGELQANMVYTGQRNTTTLSAVSSTSSSSGTSSSSVGTSSVSTETNTLGTAQPTSASTPTKFPAFTGASKLFKRVALNVNDTFSNLRIGNILQINEPTVGFNPNGGFGVNANIRITTMSFNDTADKVDMVVEVI